MKYAIVINYAEKQCEGIFRAMNYLNNEGEIKKAATNNDECNGEGKIL